jgi:hypothetical protein
MDIYKIIETLKGLEEAGDPRQQAAIAMDMKASGKKPAEESAKFSFANPKQKPGDQVRGKEVAKKKKSGAHPFANRLVGAAESVEKEFETFMNDMVDETYGMTTGGTANSTTTPAKPAPQDIAKTQQAVNKLKSAGVNIPNVQQAVKSTLKDPTEPASMQDRQVAGGLGQEIEQLLAKGDPGSINQLAALIQKNKKQGGVQ